jgi:hypothetical protein
MAVVEAPAPVTPSGRMEVGMARGAVLVLFGRQTRGARLA